MCRARPVAVGRVDRGEEDLRGQVGRPLAIADPAGDEPLHFLDVLAVEGIEQVRVGTDPAQLLSADAALAGSDHARLRLSALGGVGNASSTSMPVIGRGGGKRYRA